MPLLINGAEYLSAAEVMAEVGVSRVTLWRWRRSGKIPKGNKLRGRKVLFTLRELDAIREYALHIEPIEPAPSEQLPLFHRTPQRRA
jgi:predicted DNA-binding transcriptional regulator AlpA